MKQPSNRRSFSNRRPGAALMWTIACLAILGVALTGVMRVAAMNQRRLVARQQQLQLRWLVEAAVERGAAGLLADVNYAGETWLVPKAESAARFDAAAKIELAPVPDQARRRQLTATVRWTGDSATPGEAVKTIIVQLAAGEIP